MMPDPHTAAVRPNYGRIWLTFLRNSFVREMMFRGNSIITIISRAFWFTAQLILMGFIFQQVSAINDWSREEYFAFMATAFLINHIVEAFFMLNCANFSELIRTGNLDFALLKPIDTQFLISFERVDLPMVTQILLDISLLLYAVNRIGVPIEPLTVAVYLLYVAAGVAIFYSLMIALASTSVWFGRNQGLHDFWFYVTVLARYPQSIYSGSPAGEVLRFAFSYVIPILLAVTVPARVLLSKVLEPTWVTLFVVLAGVGTLLVSRAVFQWSLRNYRSASS